MKHIISVLVENQPGVLARVIGLISGRGYNIHSLNVAPTQDTATSRITMVVPGNERVLEQVTKQLNKLVDVIKVHDLTTGKFLNRELALVKVLTTPRNRSAVIELASLFQAKIVRVEGKSLTIEMVGSKDEVDSFLDLVKANGVLDVSRTGVIAIGTSNNVSVNGS